MPSITFHTPPLHLLHTDRLTSSTTHRQTLPFQHTLTNSTPPSTSPQYWQDAYCGAPLFDRKILTLRYYVLAHLYSSTRYTKLSCSVAPTSTTMKVAMTVRPTSKNAFALKPIAQLSTISLANLTNSLLPRPSYLPMILESSGRRMWATSIVKYITADGNRREHGRNLTKNEKQMGSISWRCSVKG